MDSRLYQSVIKTLSYFDLFDYPLTSEELYRFLWGFKGNSTYAQFVKQLEERQDVFFCEQGFWFLNGRQSIIEGRQKKVKIIEQKMQIARRGTKIMKNIPFVRAVFVCNTVASGVADADSDVDVLIVVQKGRMWLTRLLVTTTLSLFRLRRTRKKIKNRICLSFYIASDCLDVSPLLIREPDIYFVYWLGNLVPLYDPNNLLHEISRANKWATRFVPRLFEPYHIARRFKVTGRKVGSAIKHFFQKAWGGAYGDLLEGQAKKIQDMKMKRNFGSVRSLHDTRVVVSDSVLKFHEKDRREEYKEKWEHKCRELHLV